MRVRPPVIHTAAVDDAAQHITTKLVSAQDVLLAGRLERGSRVVQNRAVGSQDIGKDGHQDEHQQHAQAKQGCRTA